MNGSISSFDAARIALHVAGPPNPQLGATQLIVADVSGNNSVTSFDAAMIAKFVAGPPYTAPGIGLTATWRFVPVSKNYASITSNIAGEDYTALLMGEVSGNWANTGARPVGSRQLTVGNGPERGIAVHLPNMSMPVDNEILVPVTIQGASNKEIVSYEFDLRYDPSVIQPQSDPVDLRGTASRGLSFVVNAKESGLLRVVMYGATPIDEDGVLLNLKFTAVGVANSVTPLRWERFIFNDGLLMTAADGKVELTKSLKTEN